jgi:hypothetical protein
MRGRRGQGFRVYPAKAKLTVTLTDLAGSSETETLRVRLR